MFLVIRKRVLVIIMIIASLGVMTPVAVYTVKELSPTKDTCIVIDAGHGGIDYGVEGINTKVKESELNLEISKLINGYAESGGISSTLTRKNSNGLYGLPLPNFKRRDMNKRIKIIKDYSPEVVVSIHMNYYTASYRRGIQVFYSKNEDEEFAKCVQNYLNNTMNMDTVNRNFTHMKGDYFISKNSPCPAIIVECGFLSNPEDEKLLLDEDYRMLLSYRIFSAIIMYLETKSPSN